MKLNILERISLFSVLPREGDFATVKIIRELREKLALTEKEQVKAGYEATKEGAFWKKDIEHDFDFSRKEADIIGDALKKLDKQKKLTENHLPLYEKFVEVS